MPDAIRHVIERFPEQADAITRLAEQSEAFLSICEDYELGLVTLRQFEVEVTVRHERIAEYCALVADLELEIEQALAKAGHS
jgi:hypothetical protein